LGLAVQDHQTVLFAEQAELILFFPPLHQQAVVVAHHGIKLLPLGVLAEAALRIRKQVALERPGPRIKVTQEATAIQAIKAVVVVVVLVVPEPMLLHLERVVMVALALPVRLRGRRLQEQVAVVRLEELRPVVAVRVA
jgi:hypothetical protein